MSCIVMLAIVVGTFNNHCTMPPYTQVNGSNAAKRQALSAPAELSMVGQPSPPPPPPQQLQLQQQQQQQEPPPAQQQEITLADIHKYC